MPRYSRALLARARKIKLLLMDVDGVMTDGKIYYVPGAGGELLETKGFDSHDGMGLRFAHYGGITTGIITGRSSPAITARARDLGIRFLEQNFLEKLAPYEKIRAAAGVDDAEVCFIGDDITDLPLVARVGLGVAVANASAFLRRHAHFCTHRPGGQGAVRETIELILTAQGKWQGILESYRRGDGTLRLRAEAAPSPSSLLPRLRGAGS